MTPLDSIPAASPGDTSETRKRSHPPSPASGLDYSIPKAVWIVFAAFVLIQLASIFTLRGVADPQGYVFNASKPIAVNVYEDDGTQSIAAVLGYFSHSEGWFATFFNIGGPMLHVGRALASLAGKAGIIKVFQDPWLYLAYPEEILRVWHAYGLYKLFFLAWLPIVVWWIGNNFLTRASGLLAVVIFAAMPFLPAFEQRMKPDGVAILFGSLSLLYQLAHLRYGRISSFYLAAALLGVSFSIKTIMLPLILTLLLAGILARLDRRESTGRKILRLFAGGLIMGSVFLGLNPYLVPHLKRIFSFYVLFIADRHAEPSADLNIFSILGYRLTHFTPFFGGWLNTLVIPALLLGFWRCRCACRKVSAGCILASLFILQLFYLYAFVKDGVVHLDYYFYPSAVFLALLMGRTLEIVFEAAREAGRVPQACAAALICALLATEAYSTIQVVDYLCGKTNRQEALGWIDTFVPPGSSVGVFLPTNSSGLDSALRVDPFRYAVTKIGAKGELLDASRPQYLLWCQRDVRQTGPESPDYQVVAEFAKGRDLPQGYSYSLYQDEGYRIYKRRGELSATAPTLETSLNQFLAADPEPEFNVLVFQALGFFPISLEMCRKLPETLIPFATQAFASAFRVGTGRIEYVHNIEATTLALWGVKYVLADARPASPFQTEVAASDRYQFERLPLPPGVEISPERPVSLWRNLDYKGPALFLPDTSPLVSRQVPFELFIRGRDRIAPYGRLAATADITTSRLEVFMRVRTSGRADLVLKGGPRRLSVHLGEGITEVRVPYETAGGEAEIGYEINPEWDGTTIDVLALEARPLELLGESVVEDASASPRLGFARVTSSVPGRLILALPYHPYWTASIDGREAEVTRGPANTVAVSIPARGGLVNVRVQ